MKGIRFFGAVDRKNKHHKGAIASHMPGYFNTIQVENLKEEYQSEERRIEQGQVPPADIPFVRERIKLTKSRYESIIESRPNIRGQDKDSVAKFVKDIGKEISESMYTLSEMKLGTANAHIEASRMTDPIFKLDPEVARECGIKLTDGKTNRNGIIKAWQIGRHVLDEHTNPEILRRQ